MAISTVNEKLALITYLQPWNPPVPISADGLGQDDKQHLLSCYPGILWVAGLTYTVYGGVFSYIASNWSMGCGLGDEYCFGDIGRETHIDLIALATPKAF